MDPLATRPPGEPSKSKEAFPDTKREASQVTKLATEALSKKAEEKASFDEVDLIEKLVVFQSGSYPPPFSQWMDKINPINTQMLKLMTKEEWANFSIQWKKMTDLPEESNATFHIEMQKSLLDLIEEILPHANPYTREEILKKYSEAITINAVYRSSPETFQRFAELIRLYGLKDENLFLQIAESIARYHPEQLVIIRDKLTDSQKAFLIPPIYSLRQGCSEECLKAIIGLGIKDHTLKVEAVANAIFHDLYNDLTTLRNPIQKRKYFSAYPLQRHLTALEVDDTDSITEIFKILARRIPDAAAYNIGLVHPSVRLEVAKILKNSGKASLCHNITDFQIDDQRELFAIAKEIAQSEEGADALCVTIQNFRIKDEAKRIELARIAAQSNPRGFCLNFREFHITNPDEVFKIVLSLAESPRASGIIVQYISRFGFSEPRRIEIARKIAVSNPSELVAAFGNFDISDENTRIEIALALAAQPDSTLAEYIGSFGIKDESALIAIARILSDRNPFGLVIDFRNFNITNRDAIVELFTRLLANGENRITPMLFQIQQVLDPSNFLKIYRSAITISPHLVLGYGGLDQETIPEFLPIAIANDLSVAGNTLKILFHQDIPSLAPLSQVLSIIHDPIPSFKFYPIPEKSTLAELKEHIEKIQPGKAAIESFGLAEARRHEQEVMLRWLGFVILCCRAYHISDEQQKSYMPILLQIAAIHNPQLRIQLTEALFFQLFRGGDDVQKMMKQLSILLNHPHAQPFIPLLAPLLVADKSDFSTLLEVLNHSTYFRKNTTRRIEALKCLSAIFHQPFLTIPDKHRLLRVIFPVSGLSKANQEAAKTQAHVSKQRAARKGADLSAKKAAENALAVIEQQKKEIAELPKLLDDNLRLISALIYLRGQNDTLKKIANTAPAATFESAKLLTEELQTTVNTIFMNLFGIKITQIENLEVLLPQRNPYALVTYVRQLNQLAEFFRKPVIAYLRTIIHHVLAGTYFDERYNIHNSAHLQKLFENNKTLLESWSSGERIPFTLLKIKEMFHHEIFVERHLDPGDYGFVVKYLQVCTAEDCDAIQKILKHQREGSLNKKSIAYQRIQFQQSLIEMLNATNAVARNALLDNLPKQLKEAEKEPKLHGDIKVLNEMIEAARKLPTSDLIVEDTDEFQDLLLVGTDVHGSCQSVNANPDHSKALLGYIFDGKIRAIVVKDSNGRILARSMVRLLWDNTRQQPIMVQEKLYTSPGIPSHVHDAVTAMCLRRAQALGIPLVGASPPDQKNKNAYPHDLVSLGCPAPWEYLDTGGVTFTNGSYTLRAASIQVLWEPKEQRTQRA